MVERTFVGLDLNRRLSKGYDVLLYEFKEGVNKYLAGAGAAVKNLADVIPYNKTHAAEAMPIFG